MYPHNQFANQAYAYGQRNQLTYIRKIPCYFLERGILFYFI
jgi:hypothetical protein